MRWDLCCKSFLSILFWFLVSCSNTGTGSLPKTTSTPQLPLNQAETILPSPDGSWTAYFFGLFQNKDYRLSVANFDDSIVWNIHQKNFGGESWFIPYRWSQNSRYLYFNIQVSFSGYVPFYQGAGLQRLDVITGEISEILPNGYLVTSDTVSIYNWDFEAFSLSPNDDKLAYTNDADKSVQGVQLVIRDMKTNKEMNMLFDKYTDVGSILWSPKQDYLILAATNGTNWSNTIGFIELIELDSLTTKSILRNINQVINPLVWVNNHTVLVREYGGNYFYLDIMSEKLSPVPSSLRFPN